MCLSCHLLPAIASYLTQQNWKCLHTGNRQYTGFHIPNFGVVITLGYDIQRNSDQETPKIKLYSVRAFKCYLKEKDLIHGQVTATISKFST